MKRIYLALGDLHCPFVSRKAVTWLLDEIIPNVPDRGSGGRNLTIVQMGDLYDLFSYTRFPKRLFMTPQDEVSEGRLCAEEIWRIIQKRAPRAKCFQILGNHDKRAELRAIEKFPEVFAAFESKNLWSFSGVETHMDPKEPLIMDNIAFTHGHLSKLGDHMKKLEFLNTVCGHSHRGGVHYQRLNTGRIAWELNAGYLADPFSEATNYRPMKKFFEWTHGLGMIDSHGPRFIPYQVKTPG